ncbi:LamG domain-containing protein [Phytohabitans aurantiacus]|uniref:LamG-like jellyroll fold domain-containing protein n=1 Tax=Phytohabitans aurantiacus TaxID=3016789 RepID=A0ABQ5QZE6_9ACTN|nr:LamG-like jellyroll fold domain-containing protein [Phytohabitans aurantiacus]GLH99933.1 hypothetical protein Pa4123_52090 [Phytohabitans aurantiacus]
MWRQAAGATGAAVLLAVLGIAAVGQAAPVPLAIPDPVEVRDTPESQALAAAKDSGRSVEVAGTRSEAARVFATPDGTLVYEAYAAPRWTNRVGGVWRQVDTGLRLSETGVVAPVATLADVRFSSGGAGPLATWPIAGGQLSFSWPAALPPPELDGDTAIYRQVLPGVDLRVRALADGLSWVLVVHSREAAQNSALDRLSFGLSASGLTVRGRAEGGFEVVDGAGTVAVSAGEALMWDASGVATAEATGGSARATGTEDDEAVLRSAPDLSRKAELSTTVEGSDLVILPDADLLRGSETTYPVVIDPSTTINKLWWGYASSANATNDDGVARVGNSPDGSGNYRSFFAFNLAGLAGKEVRSAKFLTTLTHSWSCAATPVNLYRTADLGSSGKQTWDGPNLQLWLEQRYGNAHKPSGGGACPNDPQRDMPMEFAAEALKNDIEDAAGQGNYTLALSARKSDGSGESTEGWWKKFSPSATKLTVEYNSPPNTATAAQLATHAGFSAPAQACVTGAARPLVRSATPWLKATLTDPDGTGSGSLSGSFALQKWNGSTWVGMSGWPKTDSGVAHGAKAEVLVPSGVVGGDRLRWQVRTSDALGGVSNNWSPWCEFDVDGTPPGAMPSVTSADGLYLESPPKGTNEQARGGVGVSGRFTFGANGIAEVYDYVYQVSGGPEMTVVAPTLGGSVTVWVTPTHDLDNVLTVKSRDEAGNSSDVYEYVFVVAAPSGTAAAWEMNEPSGNTLAGADGGPSATVDGASRVDSRVLGSHETTGVNRALRFDGVNDYVATAAAVLDTSTSFSVSAWARPTSTGAWGAVVSQSGTTSNGPFKLQRDANGYWYFYLFSKDGSPVVVGAQSDAVAPLGVWQHVAGVYDAGVGQIRLYVNGVLQDTKPVTSSWASTGVMQVGRVHWQGTQTNHFTGDIDDVRVWQRVILPDRDLRRDTDGPLRPVLVGEWDMEDFDEEEPRQEGDGSGYQRPVTFGAAPGAQWCEGINFSKALCLDGSTTALADTGSPVLRTDQSYTVSAWVKPTALSTFPTVLSQCGGQRCAFYLQRQDNAPASWALVTASADQLNPAPTYSTAKWSGTPTLDTWVHLTGVYDADKAKIRLYVNGQFVADATAPPSWAAGGPLRLGRADSGNAVAGAIDRVRVWQGALTDAEITAVVSEA